MPLSSLQVFSEYLYLTTTELLDQQIQKFNEASAGTIVLQSSAHQGDYSDKAFYKKISGLVRRRDAYGSGAIAGVNMEHLLDTLVKVAAGTATVELDPSQFLWIQRNPEEAAAALAQQLSGDMLADMLNTSIAATYAALSNDTEVNYDGTAGTMTPRVLNQGQALFGDRSSAILAWVIHSTPMHDFYDSNLANAERLFTYETVNVMRDPFGKLFVITDSPALVEVDGGGAGVNYYRTLGLVAGGTYVGQNNDFIDNFETSNGDENISRTYQAEWSYNLGVKGYAWDKTNGGKSPNDAAIVLATNWDRYATSHKDLAGVVIETL